MLGALDDVTRLHYKKVERAPFLVLKSPDIPSILVETGFISNQKEEKRLRDANHQHKIALALYNGIRGLTLTPTSLQ
jgi:N-acetylmuramoyl-L-alanine amidase